MTPFQFISFPKSDSQLSAHFAHANGFHPEMYKYLFDELSNISVEAMLFRPYYKEQNYLDLNSWEVFAEDLIRQIDNQGKKYDFAFGHSLGGIITLIAACKRPDLFSKIILLDPVILPKKYYIFQRLPLFLRKKVIPVAKIASQRRDTWNNLEEVRSHLGAKKAYKHLPEEVFELFLKYGFEKKSNGNLTLSYSKEWETQVYATAINAWKYLKRVKCPVFIIKGEHSNVIQKEGSWDTLKKEYPYFKYSEISDSGHLVPLERSQQVAKQIINFLNN